MQTSLDLSTAGGSTALPTSLLAAATRQLSDALDRIAVPEPLVVYNPLAYARLAHERYLALAASGPRSVLFVGMNPGPWGMVQTGLPFGNIEAASWIQGIAGNWRPDDLLDADRARATVKAHLRPIDGYLCHRQEVSGSRFWVEFGPVFGGTHELLRGAFVLNVCPLAFFGPPDPTKGPRSPAINVTPDKLPRPYRDLVLEPCRTYLQIVLRLLQPRGIVCFGGWAHKMVGAWAKVDGIEAPRIEQVPHPSPRVLSSAAGWKPAAALRERGFWRHVGVE